MKTSRLFSTSHEITLYHRIRAIHDLHPTNMMLLPF
uniref:Uncharacterized protein n=1 Tax=Rhizophora mucronata TaxID=61149 RepID=A0A2P2N7A0_RHIMU